MTDNIEFNDELKITKIKQTSFNPTHIFECGQAFRWQKEEEDSSYTTIDGNMYCNVSLVGDFVYLKNCTKEDYYKKWENYFDLKTDYTKIKDTLSFNETLKSAMEYGSGIRILNQDKFSTIISFIISANNQIPRIMKSVNIICENYGDLIGELNGKKIYSFPTPEKLSKVPVEEMREICRVGFRDKRIIDVARMVATNEFDIDRINALDNGKLRNELIKLPGVGPKVADCIMLFSYKRHNTFPVDVWIKRVMEYLFIKKETNKNLISDYANKLFGDYAGYAQQYLFYYGRENTIGK
ncbi:DNA-3-methyladenine glycosylase [uncultured Finegoldia sp.]|uniref:DNA-3-methyladenine glycosylase family protein n=1 Tax=uncultured Finegoldia sp. TaxID=328009 RepID=UPI00263259C2|nr:DNA glycosylase [uncultured Finegoldia sp.]